MYSYPSWGCVVSPITLRSLAPLSVPYHGDLEFFGQCNKDVICPHKTKKVTNEPKPSHYVLEVLNFNHLFVEFNWFMYN